MGKLSNSRRGQSLIEVLIGVSFAAVLLGAAATLITATLRVGSENRFLQTAWSLNQAAMDVATAVAESGWRIVDEIREDQPSGQYFSINAQSCLAATGSGVCVPKTCERNNSYWNIADLFMVTVDDVAYYICYRVDEVHRLTQATQAGRFDQIVAAGTQPSALDRSSARISVKTLWGPQAQFETPPLVKYVMRYSGDVFHQTDWSGGPGQPGPWLIRNKFGTSSPSLKFDTVGEITIAP